MLPPAHRMRRATDFSVTVRRGRRVRRTTVVVHHLQADGTAPALVGLVVSRAVGGSVIRHRVARRLRHVMAEVVRSHSELVPVGSRTVVRALPEAGVAPSSVLAVDVEAALARLGRRP